MMTWRAELELSYCVEDDTPDVLAGYADFLIIRVGEHPMDDLLDSLSEEFAQFAELFDDDDVAGVGAGGMAPVSGSESLQGSGSGVGQAAKDKAKSVAGSAPSSLNQAPTSDDGN